MNNGNFFAMYAMAAPEDMKALCLACKQLQDGDDFDTLLAILRYEQARRVEAKKAITDPAIHRWVTEVALKYYAGDRRTYTLSEAETQYEAYWSEEAKFELLDSLKTDAHEWSPEKA